MHHTRPFNNNAFGLRWHSHTLQQSKGRFIFLLITSGGRAPLWRRRSLHSESQRILWTLEEAEKRRKKKERAGDDSTKTDGQPRGAKN